MSEQPLTRGDFAVELRGITKTFPGVIANHDVNLSVRPGTIHAIVGENGAGKSTLMKTLYGMHQPDEGTITVDGTTRTFRSPTDAIAAGIEWFTSTSCWPTTSPSPRTSFSATNR